MVAPAATLKGVDTGRIGLDPQRCAKHAEKLIRILPQIRNKVMDVFKPYQPGADTDPDHMIYSGGFFSSHDRRLMDKISRAHASKLTQQDWPFKDPRLPEMLFRFRARNFPDTLSVKESELWQEQRLMRLARPADDRQLNTETYKLAISDARQTCLEDGRAQNILDHLEAWGYELTRADEL